MIKLLIKGKQYEIPLLALKQEMKSAQNNQVQKKNSIQLPTWVESQQFEPIYSYLTLVNKLAEMSPERKEQQIFKMLQGTIRNSQVLNTTKKLIQIMRISDYLTLEKFQQYFIQECVIKALDKENCIIYLQQTHKKLKNSTSGTGTAQAWYSLLNACIDFISYHLTEVYLTQPQRIQKLHQKIIGEILDRTIKYQVVSSSKGPTNVKPSSDNSKEKQIVFGLLMKSKKVNSVDALCNCLKSNLLYKKINKKMHAKLSWKLHDLYQIVDKKVKNFKFLELNWILEAIRLPDLSLKIKLSLLPEEQPKFTSTTNHIGVFYSKLYWTMDRQLSSSKASSSVSGQTDPQQLESSECFSGQQPLSISYICFKNPTSIDIFKISNEFQKTISNRKLQLSIYCSIDQCYSFVMNHIINDYSKIRLDEKKIEKNQIYALIEGSKAAGNYSQAVWFIKYLAKNQLQIPIALLEKVPFDKLPTYEAEFLKKLMRNDNSVLDEVFGKKEQISKVPQTQSQTNSLSGSKVSDNLQTKSNNSRAPSRGRHRKIFGESPQKEISPALNTQQPTFQNIDQNTSQSPYQSRPVSSKTKQYNRQTTKTQEELQLQQLMQIANLKNYFYDQSSPILTML